MAPIHNRPGLPVRLHDVPRRMSLNVRHYSVRSGKLKNTCKIIRLVAEYCVIRTPQYIAQQAFEFIVLFSGLCIRETNTSQRIAALHADAPNA